MNADDLDKMNDQFVTQTDRVDNTSSARLLKDELSVLEQIMTKDLPPVNLKDANDPFEPFMK